MVHPEIGNEVPDEHIIPAVGLAEVDKGTDDDGKAQIAEQDQLGILGVIERASWVEMVNATEESVPLALAPALTLTLMVVVSGDVGQEVVGPAAQLLSEQDEKGDDRGLLAELRHLMNQPSQPGRPLLARLGNEDHVARHVAGGLVVLAVGDLPAKVGDQQDRVQDPANSIVEDPGCAEGLVAAFVSEDPPSGTEEPLEDGVEAPENSASRLRGDDFGSHIGVEDVEGGAEGDEVPEDVVETPDGGTLEAVLGNGIVNVLDGIVGDLELVAVCVNKLAVLLGLATVIYPGHGRERGRRSRGPGGVNWGASGCRRLRGVGVGG